MPFNYFGRKGRNLIRLYPPPSCDYIIEPFAGSARYSLKYGLEQVFNKTRKVWINDKWKVIYDVWIWIQNATVQDIRNLPNVIQEGKSLYDYKTLSEAEINLLGFCLAINPAAPIKKTTSFSKTNDCVSLLKNNLIKICGRLKHWKITNLDYKDMPNEEATWFVDPPYQHYSKYYKLKDIDYSHLRDWCLSRKGELIVCEGTGADWLDFKVLNRNVFRTRRFSGKVCPVSGKRVYDTYQELIYYRPKQTTGFIF